MANLIPEEGTRFSDPNTIEGQVREYALLKASMTNMETRSKELREKIFEYIDQNGEEEPSGSFTFDFDTPIEGLVRVEKTRRTKRKIDEQVAEEIIEQEGLQDELYKFVRTIDEDALMAALYEGKLTEDQVDSMFPIEVTWALTTKKK